ncbi:MAG: FAD-binding oxidoreductase [Gemmatimonadetes bacterium]|nr:FAD-binding oxidoreductase [Gemmatimonadota bacterium]
MKRRAFLQSAAASAAVLSLSPHPAFASVLPSSRRRLFDVEAVTGNGRTVTLSEGALSALRDQLRGRLLLANDDGYGEARNILNPSFDRRPALIVQPTGVADIQTAVNFAQDHGGLLLAVKCGGHSFSGQSTCDRGMMIDLSLFRDVRVDPVARTAWVTGGSLLGAVDHESMAHELVTPLGTVSHTGVGGLVTGGGFGRLARKYGLAIDNLKSVQVVTADGQLRRASADENPDLFWGVRGGGGNFGIVTSFEFQLHPMRRQVIAGEIVFPMSKARDALLLYGEYGPVMPDELSLGFALVQPPGDAPGMVVLDVCFCGEPNDVDQLVAPVRALGTPISDTVRSMDYTVLQRSGDWTDPRAQGLYLKGGFIPSLGGDLAAAIVDGFPAHPSRLTSIFFQVGGGAISRVPSDATAFSQRDIFANMITVSGWPVAHDASTHMQATREYFGSLERFTHGFYVNDLEPDHTAEAIQRNYRQNHARLVAVKDRYDPTNLFRLNANIRPSGEVE